MFIVHLIYFMLILYLIIITFHVFLGFVFMSSGVITFTRTLLCFFCPSSVLLISSYSHNSCFIIFISFWTWFLWKSQFVLMLDTFIVSFEVVLVEDTTTDLTFCFRIHFQFDFFFMLLIILFWFFIYLISVFLSISSFCFQAQMTLFAFISIKIQWLKHPTFRTLFLIVCHNYLKIKMLYV